MINVRRAALLVLAFAAALSLVIYYIASLPK